MKLLLSFLFLTVSASFQPAFAESEASLKQNMKQAGTLFKSIGASLSDSSKNATNAAAADQIIVLFTRTLEQLPEAIADMPEAQKQAALEDYKNMIQQEIDLTTQLRDAFLANDNAHAADVYQKMKDLKQEGHDKYNP